MKLRNKKTGEIGEFTYFADKIYVLVNDELMTNLIYNSLAELNEEWEDYEEPKEHWCITMYGGITRIKDNEEPIDDLIEIGNYFNSKEDAYDALDKLKAWKRLKDKGFEIEDWTNDIGDNYYKTGDVVLNLNNVRNRDWNPVVQISEIKNELDLLFGDEE